MILDPTVISIVCFSAIVFIVMAGYLLLRDARHPATAGVAAEVADPRQLRRRLRVYDQPSAHSLIGRLDQSFEWLVLESGSRSSAAVFLTFLACGLLVGGSLFVVYLNPLLSAIGMAVGMAVPLLWLIWQRSRTMHRVLEELPHVVDLLARAVRAGESLDQAIALVGTEFDGPLAREFRRASKQLEMGRSMTTVMKTLGARIRLLDIRLLASVLIVHRQTGGNLSQTLDRLAAVIRQRLDFRRQMRAATAGGRLSAILIVTAAPILYICAYIWHPDHFGILYEHPTGRIMLAAGLVLEVLGIILVLRILRAD